MITREEALDMFRSDDLIGIGMEADAVRRQWHPEGVVSYIIDRNINYTNFCTEYCSFCAFYRPMGHAEGYILPNETIFDKIQETIDLGGTGVLMQGGLHPDLKIEWYEDLLRNIKQRFRDPPALLFRAGGHEHRRSQRPDPARHHRAPDGRRTRFHSRRRRGNSGRCRAPPHQPPEVRARRNGWTCIAPPTSSACAPPPP